MADLDNRLVLSGKTISINTISVFQDDSITKATSGSAGNIGEFNPFTGTEMVWCFFFIIIFLLLCKWLFCQNGCGFVWQERTVPISAASSEPAILHTSVEQNPQVSHTCRNTFFSYYRHKLNKNIDHKYLIWNLCLFDPSSIVLEPLIPVLFWDAFAFDLLTLSSFFIGLSGFTVTADWENLNFVLKMAEENVLVLLQTSAAAGQANLIRQQEELDRKAAELERKEQEMQNRSRASSTGGELLHEGMRAVRPHVGNSSVVCLQLRKTTGRLYQTSPPWSRAFTRTLRRKSQRSTAGYAGGCITSGCVRTNSMDNAMFRSQIDQRPSLQSTAPRCFSTCWPAWRISLRMLHMLLTLVCLSSG